MQFCSYKQNCAGYEPHEAVQRLIMGNRAHRLRFAILFVGIFLALVCQVELSPEERLHKPSENGPDASSDGVVICAPNPLMASTVSLVVYPCIITAFVAVVLGAPAQGHTLPLYRPPRSIV